MNFQNAGVADILRLNQKDEQFLERYNNAFVEFLRLTTNLNLNKIRKYASYLSQSCYYFLTSLSNLQTLGEEYTSLIRYNKSSNNIPSKTSQVIWLLFHIFGKNMFTIILENFEKKVSQQKIQSSAKSKILKICKSLRDNQEVIIRFHLAVFYLQKKYYNISNRLTGIEYMCFTKSEKLTRPFDILGTISVIYLISNLIYNIYDTYKTIVLQDNVSESKLSGQSSKECYLCAEDNIVATALSCGHHYCWNCVFELINNTGVCPICREPIERNSVVMLQNY